MDQRYGRVSTIITTNLEYSAWYGLFDNKPLVDALLDRLHHHCITWFLNTRTKSRRVPQPTPDDRAGHAGADMRRKASNSVANY